MTVLCLTELVPTYKTLNSEDMITKLDNYNMGPEAQHIATQSIAL